MRKGLDIPIVVGELGFVTKKKLGKWIDLLGIQASVTRVMAPRTSLMTIGICAGRGRGGAAVLSKFGQLRFFGPQEKFGQGQFLKKFACVCVHVFFFFFSKREIFYFKLKSGW